MTKTDPKEYSDWDVIGDIHGHADALEALLRKLDFAKRDGVWQHPERGALFAGDFVDRGPENIRTCQIVMDMIDAGSARAVMGNHEFNHVTLDMPNRNREGEFLRPHTHKNLRQAEATLREFERAPDLKNKILTWMGKLPIWLDLPKLRVVHASWDNSSQKILMPWLSEHHALKPEGFQVAAQKGHPVQIARDVLINGPEWQLPSGIRFRDKDGHEREEGRVKWWLSDRAQLTWRDALIGPSSMIEQLPPDRIGLNDLPEADTDLRPIIFGHYWMEAPLSVLGPLHACVDASVAKGGKLAAYCFSGEAALTPDHFVYV
jgi:hypothetical protein